jgi:WhiB family redox-sensing transcriptional regulator
MDPEWYFPDKGQNAPEYQQVKALCSTCVFVEPCLEYALHVKVMGVWGGTTEVERKAIRRKRNIFAEPLLFGGDEGVRNETVA